MDEMDHKECWAPKNWHFWIMVLEKTLESPLNCMEIKPVISKGNHSWIFFGRTDAGRDWGQEEKGTTEDEMAGWHHWLDGCESEWTLGVGDRQGSLRCCSRWDYKESDMAEQLNWTDSVVEWVLLQYDCHSKRRRGWHKMRWLDGITDSMDMSLGSLC